MLNCDAQNLYIEIRAALNARDKITRPSEELHAQYFGEAWQDGRQPAVPSHENHAFEYVKNTRPFLIYNNPKVRVRSKRPAVQRKLAAALTHGMNRWIRDVDLETTLGEVAQDCLFDFGVVLVTLEPLPGYEDKETPPLRPMCSRISPRRFFADPQATSKRNPRFLGHEWLRDKDDLRAAREADPANPGKTRAVYDQQALEKVGVDDNEDFYSGRGSELLKLAGGVERVPRNQVRGFEVFVPEKKMIYTLAYQQTSGGDRSAYFLRAPRPYFGPPWGPYTLFGLHIVADQLYPLAPLAVTATLVTEMNAHIDQITEQADSARQFTIVNATNTKAVESIKNARNGETVSIPGFDATQALVITYGGPSKEQLAYVEGLRLRLDRKSGLADFARGNVTGDATLGENQLAANALDIGRKEMKKAFRVCVTKVLETAGWLMMESKNVVFNVPVPKSYFAEGDELQDQGGEQGMEDGLFLGGRQEGEEESSWFDLEIEIEPMSMEMVDDATIRAEMQQCFAMLMEAAPLMMQVPYLNWPSIMDDLFESINVRDGRKYINFELLQQMIQMQFAAGQAAEEPGVDGAEADDPASMAPGGIPQIGIGPTTVKKGSAGRAPGGRQSGRKVGGAGAAPQTLKLAALLGKPQGA